MAATTSAPSPVKLAPAAYGRSAPLTPRNHPWIRNSVIALATAAGTPAACDIAGMHGAVVPLGAAAMTLTAVAIARSGHRKHLRALDFDRCAEQICTVLGLPPTRSAMRATQWRDGHPGRPGQIEVRYSDAGTELDPDWLTRVDEVISGQSWGRYKRAEHDNRHCRLVYVFDDSPLPEPDPEPVARAKRLVLKILGPTSVITNSELDEHGVIKRIEARHDDGARFALSGYRDRIERTVSAVLPGRWRARWDLVADTVVFEVRPSFPEIIWNKPIPDPDLPYEKVAVRYAQDEDGNVMFWRPCIDPHFIFIGATGTGKTAAVHTVLTDLAARGWMCWVVDGKGMEFIGFQTWPNVQIVAARMEHQVAVIHRAWEEMEFRYTAIADGASEEDFTPIVVVIDEFADFKANLENWYSLIKVKGDPSQPRTLIEVASLVRKGRSARIHLVLSTQRPDADFFSGRGRGDTRDSLRMRVSLGPLSPQGAAMMWYSQTVGTTIPRGIRGRATGINEHNEPVEIQCFYTPDPRRTPVGTQGHDQLEMLRPSHAIHQRVVVLPADEDFDDFDDEDDEDESPRRRRNSPRSLFQATVRAEWGWASEHPEHDPVARRQRTLAARREHSGPVTLLGLAESLGTAPALPSSWNGTEETSEIQRFPEVDETRHATGDDDVIDGTVISERSMTSLLASAAQHQRSTLRVVPDQPSTPTAAASDPDLPDPWEGYGEADDVAPDDVEIGDLVLIDEAAGIWGVVNGEPGPALLSDDEGMLEITCRTDDDGEEVIEVPDTGSLTIRRPLDTEQ